jgi:hypothetical protein
MISNTNNNKSNNSWCYTATNSISRTKVGRATNKRQRVEVKKYISKFDKERD